MSSEQERQAKYESVYVTPEYKQQLEQAAKIAKAKREAEQLKPLDLITEAPEGYYYKSEDVENYNREVLEYNKKLRDYKRELSKAEMDSKIGKLNLELYETQRKTYLAELERTAPDRVAFLEYIKGIGPPDPTEEQKRRQAEGLPITGIPGPGAGPKPGSIGEKIQSVIGPPVIEIVKGIEETFRRVTIPVRKTSEELGEASLASAQRGDAVIGEGQYLASVVLGTAAMAFDIATFEFRPQLWVDVGRTIGGLVFEPETREAFVEQITRDPFRFGVEMAGGAYLGSRLQQVDWVKLGEKTLEKTVKGAEWIIKKVPQEDPFRGMSQLDRYLASEPYKVRTFLEGPAKTMFTGELIQTPRLSRFFRTLAQESKLRPWTGDVDLTVPYWQPSQLYGKALIEEIKQFKKIRPPKVSYTVPYWQPSELYVQTGARATSWILDAIEETKQITKLRLPKNYFTVEYWRPSELYLQTGFKDTSRILDLIEEAKQVTKFRLPKDYFTVEYRPGAVLEGDSAISRLLEEVRQTTKLRPRKGFLLEKYGYDPYLLRAKYEPRLKFHPSIGEQLKALEEYRGDTYIARAEAFMRKTFTPERYIPVKPISVASLEVVSTTKNLADTAKAVALMLEEADRSLPVSRGPPGLYAAPPKLKKAPQTKDGWAKLSSAYFPKMSPELSKQLLDLEVGIKTVQPQKLRLETIPVIKTGKIEKNAVKNLDKIKITQLPDIRVASLEKIEPISISRQELKLESLEKLVFSQTQVSASLIRSKLRMKQLLKPKKKTKKRKRRKEAWELRVDKILKFEFKEPKIKL